MQPTIKPIETVYNGYRFRSRLEARWAVFFDTLGVPYEYEKEGYNLGDGMLYLPDFWLPEQDAFVEIKPITEWGFNEKSRRLCLHVEKNVLFTCGNPWPGEYQVGLYEWDDGHCFSHWYPCRYALGRRSQRELWVVCDDLGAKCLNSLSDDERWPLDSCSELDRAYGAARQARFEHGAHGR